jgi:SAM-dependent methyltransferase
MPHALQHLALPLYRLAHRPEPIAYQHAERRYMLDRCIDAIPDEARGTVIEMGCGDGWVAHQLAQRFERVVGYDINPHRIEPPTAGNVLLLASEAERPPIAPASADAVFSFAVFEHLPQREVVLEQLTALLKPGGVMVHAVPTATMKLLQYAGFFPDKLRRELRNLTRTLAGQKKHRPPKPLDGFETNNPRRASRRRWHQKLGPRVHGEYDSNWQETLQNRVGYWRHLFESTGLRCTRVVPLGLWSPYFFGGAPLAKLGGTLGLGSVHAFVLQRPSTDAPA